MRPHLYTVTLNDLGEYTITVAADSEADAIKIASGTLLEEATTACPNLSVTKREVQGTAKLAESPPQSAKIYRVEGTYTVEFHIDVPAQDRDDAQRHARRLYELQPFPWEYANDGGNVRWGYVREAVS
jgi:hypothetical protein